MTLPRWSARPWAHPPIRPVRGTTRGSGPRQSREPDDQHRHPQGRRQPDRKDDERQRDQKHEQKRTSDHGLLLTARRAASARCAETRGGRAPRDSRSDWLEIDIRASTLTSTTRPAIPTSSAPSAATEPAPTVIRITPARAIATGRTTRTPSSAPRRPRSPRSLAWPEVVERSTRFLAYPGRTR
jgi:hypothetical protein